MRRYAFVPLVLCVALTGCAQSNTADPNLDQTLRQREEDLLKAIEAPTPDQMKTLVTADAYTVDAGGVTPASAYYEMWNRIKVTGHSTSDMKVMALGNDAGLVTYKLMQTGTVDGQPLPPTVYATTAWTRRNGQWVAAFHQEVAPAPAPGSQTPGSEAPASQTPPARQ